MLEMYFWGSSDKRVFIGTSIKCPRHRPADYSLRLPVCLCFLKGTMVS